MYQKAILRKPGENFHAGQTDSKLGTPAIPDAINQHQIYCDVLNSIGLELMVLDADPQYPDGCFVEDTAVILDDVAVITNIGHQSRTGETLAIAQILQDEFELNHLAPDATVDGGDVLRVGSHFVIGVTKRTNQQGALALGEILKKHGFSFSIVPVSNTLHLKSVLTYLGEQSVAIREDQSHLLEHLKGIDNVVYIPLDESYAANCLAVNGSLLISTGFPKTEKLLQSKGFDIKPVPMTEFEKMNGSLTCLSLLY